MSTRTIWIEHETKVIKRKTEYLICDCCGKETDYGLFRRKDDNNQEGFMKITKSNICAEDGCNNDYHEMDFCLDCSVKIEDFVNKLKRVGVRGF